MKINRPILFSAEMVRACLALNKTQTRRTRGLDYFNESPDLWRLSSVHDGYAVFHGPGRAGPITEARCPYGAPGDRLWVRETFTNTIPAASMRNGPVSRRWLKYRADGEIEGQRWTPPIHMPRWASRIMLAIESVKVERLQAISGVDAWAEGVNPGVRPGFDVDIDGGLSESGLQAGIDAFRNTWDTINGKRPGCDWASNPWVWAITFRPVTEATPCPT